MAQANHCSCLATSSGQRQWVSLLCQPLSPLHVINMLLALLFFYDIFFVFGTDVMLTVAKGIDAPIKLQFPKDYSGEKP